MRIVGGELSGRRFSGPKGDATRPTAERVREAVFSALEARGVVVDARLLDLYAGTGALAFEALSRGATDAVSVERDPRIARAIESDARALGLDGRHETLVLDLTKPSTLARLRGPFTLVLADPPWDELGRAVDVLSALTASDRLTSDAHVVLVHAQRDPHPALTPCDELATYRYGDTAVVVYRKNDGGPARADERSRDDD